MHFVFGEIVASVSHYIYAVIELMTRSLVVCKPMATIALFWCKEILRFHFCRSYWLFLFANDYTVNVYSDKRFVDQEPHVVFGVK